MQHELIEIHGYTAETHYVWTEDDYRLDVHRVLPPEDRIPPVSDAHIIDWSTSGKNHNTSVSPESCDRGISETSGTVASLKIPVLVHHGLLSSSADFVLLGSNDALG